LICAFWGKEKKGKKSLIGWLSVHEERLSFYLYNYFIISEQSGEEKEKGEKKKKKPILQLRGLSPFGKREGRKKRKEKAR